MLTMKNTRRLNNVIKIGTYKYKIGSIRTLVDDVGKPTTTTNITKPVSISFSGSGWLVPFHLGVLQSFTKGQDIIPSSDSILAGTSGGSLCALMGCAGFSANKALSLIVQLSRNSEFNNDINAGLKKHVRPLLPPDILERCNGKLHVTVTKVW
jgi:hypothetical protein